MTEIDLWSDEEVTVNPSKDLLPQDQPITGLWESEYLVNVPSFSKKTHLEIKDNRIILYSKVDLKKHKAFATDLNSLLSLKESIHGGVRVYDCSLGAVNAFILRHVLAKVEVDIAREDGMELKEYADRIWQPSAKMSDNGKYLEVNLPNIDVYTSLAKKVGGYPTKSAWRINIARVLDFESMANSLETTLPKIHIDTSVLALSREPLPGFDGTLNSLKEIPVGVINVVNSNNQSMKSLKTSSKTLEEKINDFGITNLYDLLFTLPKRFIDKSNPQELESLIEGESATLVGIISKIELLPNSMGVYFVIENGRGKQIKCNFWRQQWLKSKYKVGDEVLLTGKASWYRKKLELGGSSIEHLDEASVLPIVPVYKQSESKGITTNLLMAANRELIARAGNIDLPAYLRVEDRMDYTEALTELHFPSSLERFKEACDDLAYYELVYMQLILQEERQNTSKKKGVAQVKTARDLQNKAYKSLPFQLTKSQVLGIMKIDKLIGSEQPSQILLNADVGAGKSICAHLACMRTIESGKQAVIIGPTEILARQLYDTFIKVNSNLGENKINIAFLGAGMKVAERKPILKGLEDGSIDAVVGTTSVISDKVKYADLGLVVVDEQQKFGAAQRSKLLNSRGDGLIPDLLMMSATPIPRSTAQIFYGDMEMIELPEKPAGRLPIVTEWVMEDPVEFSRQIANPVWSDIQNEAKVGNQTFVITPMVADSDKVDAASVERTFKNLSETTLAGLNVGFVHGQMKKDQQQETMAKFRNKEYDVIVASTVVEVGVDIPDATRVVILSADRLGASSLHQIRGRVGRNSKQSKCYLVSLGKTENSQIRLQALVDSENGFEIALSDLSVRGEGKIFGSDQSGSSEMIFASLAKHREWIDIAKDQAKEILASPAADEALKDAKERFNVEERLF